MKIIGENLVDDKKWRAFVDQHPQGNIFHTPEMFEVYRRARGYKPQLWAALGGEGKILALLPTVQVTLKDGMFGRLTGRNIAYGGLLSAYGPQGDAALAALLEEYTRSASRQALFSELRHLSDQQAIQPVLEGCGFAFEEHLNYLVDLGCSPEQVLQNIGSRTRKHIRQAIRKGTVTVEEVATCNQLTEWYEVVRKTYLNACVPLAERSLFDAAFDVLQPRGMVKFWLAKIGSAYVAASVELLYKDTVYGWYGGTDREYAKDMPGEVLTWHILEWGACSGYKVYDFGGAGRPCEEYGVRDFKAKFGGRLVCFGRNRKVHYPRMLNLSQKGYQIYQKLVRRFSSVSSLLS